MKREQWDQLQPIASCPGWRLFEFSNRRRPGWLNVLLVPENHLHKTKYYFGFNTDEQRIARNHDAGALAKYDAEIYAWVEQVLSEYSSR